MTLYLSTTCLPGLSHRETLEAYERLGVERVELGYYSNPELDLVEIVESFGFEYAAHNYFRAPDDPFILNLASQNPEIRERSAEYVRNSVDFCKQVGIDYYGIHAGFRTDPDSDLNFVDADIPKYDQSMDTFVDTVADLVSYGVRRGVELAIENNVVESKNVVDGEPQALLAEPFELNRLFGRSGVERMSLLLDTGHLTVTANTLGFDRIQFLRAAREFVSWLHLHTNDGLTDQHDPVSADCWSVELYDELHKQGVPGTIESWFETEGDLGEFLTQMRASGYNI